MALELVGRESTAHPATRVIQSRVHEFLHRQPSQQDTSRTQLADVFRQQLAAPFEQSAREQEPAATNESAHIAGRDAL